MKKSYNLFDLQLWFEARNFEANRFQVGSPTFVFWMVMNWEVNPIVLEHRCTDARMLFRPTSGNA